MHLRLRTVALGRFTDCWLGPLSGWLWFLKRKRRKRLNMLMSGWGWQWEIGCEAQWQSQC